MLKLKQMDFSRDQISSEDGQGVDTVELEKYNQENVKKAQASTPIGPKAIEARDHVSGSLEAPVTVLVYGDFVSSFSADFNDELNKAQQEFGDKIAVAFRHFALASDASALAPALAAECAAEQGEFWSMSQKLFADNRNNELHYERFKIDAQEIGLDLTKFEDCYKNNRYAEKIASQIAEGKTAGVVGTPTFFVNGKVYPGAYPYEDFVSSDGTEQKGLKSIIEENLNQ